MVQKASSWSLSNIDLGQFAADYGIPFVKAIAVLVVGLWIVGIISKIARRYMEKSSLGQIT